MRKGEILDVFSLNVLNKEVDSTESSGQRVSHSTRAGKFLHLFVHIQ